MLLKILEKGYQTLQENSAPSKKLEVEELREYKDELMFLMKRIQNHPSNENYKVKITLGSSESELRLVADESSPNTTLEKGRTA